MKPDALETITTMNIEEFIQIVTTAPSADNSQPWQFTVAGEKLIVKFHDRQNGHNIFGPLGHGTLISAGAIHENIKTILTAAHQGKEFNVLIDEQHGWRIEIPIESINESPIDDTSHRILCRHTNRHPYKPIPATPNIPLVHSESTDTRITLLTEKSSIQALTSSLRSCSEARFNDQELHEWLFSSIRWSERDAQSGTGLDISTLHLPPGGRHFMQWMAPWERMQLLNRYGIYKILALADSSLMRQAPAVIVLSGGSSVRDIWNAGRCMQRTWIELNEAGIAVHPYYAITDLLNSLQSGKLNQDWKKPISLAQANVRELLSLETDEHLHMVFRIGLPTVNPVRSQRLPASSFLVS